MNDFLYQEILTEEYRRNLRATAEIRNRYAGSSGPNFSLRVYVILSRIGALLERSGANMQTRYNRLAIGEQCNMMSNPAK